MALAYPIPVIKIYLVMYIGEGLSCASLLFYLYNQICINKVHTGKFV